MISNQTKKNTIIKKVQYCKSLFSKFRGLMFTKKKERALIFFFNKPTRVDLHMFFVFYPIDVVFLNEKKQDTLKKIKSGEYTLTNLN